MFTGIVEEIGSICQIQKINGNIDFWVSAHFINELKIDQSIAHNGVCLTIVAIKDAQYKVTAVAETLQKTNLNNWVLNEPINLERALKIGDRLDGHFVQGHVDAIGICTAIEKLTGSWVFHFETDNKWAELFIEKGSITINGVSLTVFNVGANNFCVTIIPYTFEHTNFQNLKINEQVNLEFDVLGKYFLRKTELNKN